MKRHPFKCPNCSSNYDIWTYHIGFSDVNEHRCDGCPTVMMVDIYSPVALQVRREIFGEGGPKNKDEAFSKLDEALSRLSERVGPCHCGGKFSHKALHRCPQCNAEITMDEIKRQIKWWGSADGRPGVVTKDYMDQDGRRSLPED
jgi:hypothetical protein